MANIASLVRAHLESKALLPTAHWLQEFIQSIRPATPLPALKKTAEFRLLGSDITSSLQTSYSSSFPAGISNPDVKELRIPGPIPVQLIEIEDIGRSRWSQVEAIEMDEKGETRKGHEVIRVVPDEEDNSDPNPPTNQASSPAGPHKLLVQDARGNKAYAFELQTVPGIGVEMAIGSKLVLKDFVVARGVILLTRTGTEILGGRIDAWDKQWRQQRKAVLKQKAGWTAIR